MSDLAANSVEAVVLGVLAAHEDWHYPARDAYPQPFCICGESLGIRSPGERGPGGSLVRDLHRAHLAAAVAAAMQERVRELADEMEAFDCLLDDWPHSVDVPDDYERGMQDAGRRINAHLNHLLGEGQQ